MIDKFSILNKAKYSSSGIYQSYLVVISAKKYIKYFTGSTRIELWKFNGMSKKRIENTTKSDSNFVPIFADHLLLPAMNFNGHWLIKKFSIPRKVINLYISYTLAPQLRNLNMDFTLANCFFGPVKLIKNADLDKYKYTRHSIGFASRIFIYRWKL